MARGGAKQGRRLPQVAGRAEKAPTLPAALIFAVSEHSSTGLPVNRVASLLYMPPTLQDADKV